MISTNRLVIVEGKYDKIRLESVLDAIILPTNGFSIFKDKEKTAFIQRYAKEHGVLILTDSDAAGFKIRNYFASVLPSEAILNAYIPDIPGKEKRKTEHSAEGNLGVEGMTTAVLIDALKKAGIEENEVPPNHTSAFDLFEKGFLGCDNASVRRARLCKRLGLPQRISKNNLLKYINRNLSKQDFEIIINEILEEKDV